MNRSDTICELSKALVAAQGAIAPAALDGANPAFKSRYATLASLWQSARPALSKNGLAIVQNPIREEMAVGVETWIIHLSGEWMASRLMLPMNASTAQATGSALTYARRYSLASILGLVADEDDDGHQASVQALPQAGTQSTKVQNATTPSQSGEKRAIGYICDVQIREGTKDGKAWKLWTVILNAGSGRLFEGSTFDQKIGEPADRAKGSEAAAEMVLIPGAKQGTFKIQRLSIEDTVPAPQAALQKGGETV
jgi:hypothetical protein